jgi:ParB family chromosome partitioning protein
MTTHNIKCIHELFEDKIIGNKPWEMRWNDRNYKVGDILIQHEIGDTDLLYTGRTFNETVIYMMEGPRYGLREGWVIMTTFGGFLTTPEKFK